MPPKKNKAPANPAPKKTGNDVDIDEFSKELGLNIFKGSVAGERLTILPSFIPSLDKLLDGGLPFGRGIEFSGPYSSGKSTLSYHYIRVAIELGCIPVLLDSEGSTTEDYLQSLGIDSSKMMAVATSKETGKKLTVEDVGRTIEKVLTKLIDKKSKKQVVFIWDSVGDTPSEVEQKTDWGDQEVGQHARALKQLSIKTGGLIEKTNSMLIAINQIRDVVGGYGPGPKTKTPGGVKWNHFLSSKFEVRRKGSITRTVGGDKLEIGQETVFKVIKSKSSIPRQSIDLSLMFGKGFDYEQNLVESALKIKLMTAPGASYSYIDSNGTEHKKSRTNFIEFLKSEEGTEVRADLLKSTIVEFFPNHFPPLDNATLDIEQWSDAKGLRDMYKNKAKEPAPEKQTETEEDHLEDDNNLDNLLGD